MIRRSVYFLSFFLFSFFSSFLFSYDKALKKELSKIISNNVDKLIANGSLIHSNYNGSQEGVEFKLNLPLLSQIEKEIPLRDSIFNMEVLHLTKKNKKDDQKDISKILRSVSSLKGLEYYSPSRKSMRLLYKDSYAVSREKDKSGNWTYTKVKDPLNEKLEGLSIFVLQEDLTFGKNIYKFNYFKDEHTIGLLVYNEEPLYYSIFKVMSEKDVNSVLLVYELKDHLLFYATTKARFKKIIGMDRKIKNSFMARLDAMYNWFIQKYNS